MVAGAYGGYPLDRRLLIGAGAYWLDSELTELSYFGPLVEWSTKTGGRFDLSVRALVGLGSATRYGDFGAFVDHDALGDTHAQHGADVSALSFPGRSGRGFGRGFIDGATGSAASGATTSSWSRNLMSACLLVSPTGSASTWVSGIERPATTSTSVTA